MRVEVLPIVLGILPASAWAADYLSASEAEALMFPLADEFAPVNVSFDNAQLQEIGKRAGITARSAQWGVLVARRANATLGYVVIDNVIGKFELITYAVAVETDGAIRQIEILSYRESHGGEIRLPAWRRQFVGKTVAGPLRVGEDIANLSGATLSCNHVTDGVRRIVAVLQVAREAGALP
ncbi:MAG TPA: FMN-binding protein [Burkholderiaceae bacterium]|nr:FMN-binding protein [Burkholderiaceae bacterium]